MRKEVIQRLTIGSSFALMLFLMGHHGVVYYDWRANIVMIYIVNWY